MEKKNKKNLTIKQKANKHKINSKILYATKPIATATPMAITMAVKGQEWFNIPNEGPKIAIGGTIAIIIMAISSLLVNKKTEDKTITNSWITLVLGWYAVAFIFMLLGQIMHEIWWIMMVAGSGMLASAGIDVVEKNELKQYELMKSGIEEAEKETIKEQVKEELKKQQPTE